MLLEPAEKISKPFVGTLMTIYWFKPDSLLRNHFTFTERTVLLLLLLLLHILVYSLYD